MERMDGQLMTVCVVQKNGQFGLKEKEMQASNTVE